MATLKTVEQDKRRKVSSAACLWKGKQPLPGVYLFVKEIISAGGVWMVPLFKHYPRLRECLSHETGLSNTPKVRRRL
jgi:hypothetical protein